MHTTALEPDEDDARRSSLAPAPPINTDLRRRSFPSHIIQEQQKEAKAVKETIKEIHVPLPPPPYDVPLTKELSFLQQHFYRSTSSELSDGEDSQTRRFSLLSKGSLICAGVLVLMLIAAIISAVLATVYHKKHMGHSPVKEAILANFPDPAIIQHEGLWYAFATNNGAGVLSRPANMSPSEYGAMNVQIATSSDFSNWTRLGAIHDPLPILGSWVLPTYSNTTPPANVWAPEILQRPSDGKFVMYYSAVTANHSTHCVGAAISDTGPAGPYAPVNDTITCPTKEGGAIDAVSFVDADNTIYLAWKIDGNNAANGGICGNTVPPLKDTPIMLQKMKSDGVTIDGEAIIILDRTKSDGPLVEAPSIIRSDEGIYFLFFSSGCTRDPSYDLKYAWSYNITGPYERAHSPLLKTGSWGLLAPGSVGIRRSEDGEAKMAFHARVTTDYGRVRAMFTSTLMFKGSKATMVL